MTEQETNYLVFVFVNVKFKLRSDVVDLDSKVDFFDYEEFVKSSSDDRLDQALKEFRDAVVDEVLENLLQVFFSRFEVIVLDVLYRLGYGGYRDDLQRVGGIGDGGIDGVISFDKFGLEKVYVQVKRWQNIVGRLELQVFYGVLVG